MDEVQNLFAGAGMGNPQDVAMLLKALEVGHLRGGDPAAQSGGSLKVESLEKTLKILAERPEDMQLFNSIPKLPAYSTVEEYEQLLSYGNDNMGGFIGEGELPEETDASYLRKAALVKYIGVTKQISHQAMLTNLLVGDIRARETINATTYVLKKADIAIAKGDSGPVPFEWDGLYKIQSDAFNTLNEWQDSNSVIDCRGDFLREEYIESASEGIVENHGFGDLLMAPPKVLSNFVKKFHESKLIMPNTSALTDGIMGQRVKTFMSQFGSIDIRYDKFLKSATSRKSGDGATHAKAPAKPVKDAVTPIAATADTSSRFGAAFDGDYFIGVSAINRYGESQIEMLSNALVTVAAAESLDGKFAAGAGAYAPTGYVIYRSELNPTTALADTPLYPVFKVSTTNLATGYDGGAAGIVRDRNRFIPNTDSAFLIENNDQIWSLKQLLPIVKMDLARISPAERFMVLMYAVPNLYAPKKMARFVNVGKYVAP